MDRRQRHRGHRRRLVRLRICCAAAAPSAAPRCPPPAPAAAAATGTATSALPAAVSGPASAADTPVALPLRSVRTPEFALWRYTSTAMRPMLPDGIGVTLFQFSPAVGRLVERAARAAAVEAALRAHALYRDAIQMLRSVLDITRSLAPVQSFGPLSTCFHVLPPSVVVDAAITAGAPERSRRRDEHDVVVAGSITMRSMCLELFGGRYSSTSLPPFGRLVEPSAPGRALAVVRFAAAGVRPRSDPSATRPRRPSTWCPCPGAAVVQAPALVVFHTPHALTPRNRWRDSPRRRRSP
jgi:hypothetical protein